MPQPKRLSAATKLDNVRDFIHRKQAVTVHDVAKHLKVSTRYAGEYLSMLRKKGEIIETGKTQDNKKLWKLHSQFRRRTVQLSILQMVSLFLSKTHFSIFKGTGIKEHTDELYEQLQAILKTEDRQLAQNLDRKYYTKHIGPRNYHDRAQDVIQINAAIIQDNRLRVKYSRVEDGAISFILEPYSLVSYKTGLYVVGYSEYHKKIDRFCLDDLQDVEWLEGDTFDYPEDYHPAHFFENVFGIIAGDPVDVELHFSSKVRPYVYRSKWVESQKNTLTDDGGVVTTMRLKGTIEADSWIMSFGQHAAVARPQTFWKEMYEEAKASVKFYEAIGRQMGYLPPETETVG